MLINVPNWSARIAGCPEDTSSDRLRYPDSQSRYGPNNNDCDQDFYPDFLLFAHAFERIVRAVLLIFGHRLVLLSVSTPWPHRIVFLAVLSWLILCELRDSGASFKIIFVDLEADFGLGLLLFEGSAGCGVRVEGGEWMICGWWVVVS